MFICGSRSFSHQDRDENYSSNCWALKRSKRSKSFSKILTGKYSSNKTNPYANRGLDKFSALLADHDDKRQEIYAQMGSEDISFVQFVYSSDSKHVKPIVVKVQNKKSSHDFLKHIPSNMSKTVTSNSADESDKSFDAIQRDRETVTVLSQEQKKEYSRKISPRWNKRFMHDNLRRPSFYCFPTILVFILLFLAIYGRSFAILCTTMSWYLIPTIVGESSSSSSSSSSRKKRLIFHP